MAAVPLQTAGPTAGHASPASQPTAASRTRGATPGRPWQGLSHHGRRGQDPKVCLSVPRNRVNGRFGLYRSRGPTAAEHHACSHMLSLSGSSGPDRRHTDTPVQTCEVARSAPLWHSGPVADVCVVPRARYSPAFQTRVEDILGTCIPATRRGRILKRCADTREAGGTPRGQCGPGEGQGCWVPGASRRPPAPQQAPRPSGLGATPGLPSRPWAERADAMTSVWRPWWHFLRAASAPPAWPLDCWSPRWRMGTASPVPLCRWGRRVQHGCRTHSASPEVTQQV